MIYILYEIINRSFFKRIANERSEFTDNHIFINPSSYLDKLNESMKKRKDIYWNLPIDIDLQDYIANYVPMFAKYQMRQLCIMLAFSIDTSNANATNTKQTQEQANEHLRAILTLICDHFAFGWKTLKINGSKNLSDNSTFDTIVKGIMSDLIDSSSCNHEDPPKKYSSLVSACKRHAENPYVSLYNDKPTHNVKSSIMALDSKGRKIVLPYCELQFVAIYCINEAYCSMIVDCTDKELHINKNLANTDESLVAYQWSYSMLKMFNEVFYNVFEGMKHLFRHKLKLLEIGKDKRKLASYCKRVKPRITALSFHFLKHLIPIFIFDFIESQKGIFMNDGSSFFNGNVCVKWESQKFSASKCLSLLASAFPTSVGTSSYQHTEEVSDKIFAIPTFGALFDALFIMRSKENKYPDLEWITEAIKTAKIGIDNGGSGILFTEIIKAAVAICCKTPNDGQMSVKQIFYPIYPAKKKMNEDVAASVGDDSAVSDSAAADDDDIDDRRKKRSRGNKNSEKLKKRKTIIKTNEKDSSKTGDNNEDEDDGDKSSNKASHKTNVTSKNNENGPRKRKIDDKDAVDETTITTNAKTKKSFMKNKRSRTRKEEKEVEEEKDVEEIEVEDVIEGQDDDDDNQEEQDSMAKLTLKNNKKTPMISEDDEKATDTEEADQHPLIDTDDENNNKEDNDKNGDRTDVDKDDDCNDNDNQEEQDSIAKPTMISQNTEEERNMEEARRRSLMDTDDESSAYIEPVGHEIDEELADQHPFIDTDDENNNKEDNDKNGDRTDVDKDVDGNDDDNQEEQDSIAKPTMISQNTEEERDMKEARRRSLMDTNDESSAYSEPVGHEIDEELEIDKKETLYITSTNFIDDIYHYINDTSEYETLIGEKKDAYAELDCQSMEEVIKCMKEKQEFNTSSKFLDIGCGIGKPNLCAANDPGVVLSYGVEIHKTIFTAAQKIFQKLHEYKGFPVIKNMIELMLAKCHLQNLDIKNCDFLNHFTHVFMHDTA